MSAPAPSAATAEPELSDLEIASRTAALKDQLAAERPLLGAAEPISTLADEYRDASETFRAKIESLRAAGWTHIRRLRGDGDCLCVDWAIDAPAHSASYRAFAVRYISRLIGAPPSVAADALARVERCAPSLEAAGFQRDITDDFLEPFAELLKAPPKDEAGLLEAFNDQATQAYCVTWLRLATSAYLRAHVDDFLPFLFSYEADDRIIDPETGMPDMARFCGHHVEAVQREADQIQIVALTKALDVGLTVANLDQSAGVDGGREVNWTICEGSLDFGPDTALLLRPGHFDLLHR